MIVKKNKTTWVFNHGKHPGKTIEKVAEVDPGYLTWLRNDVDANKDMPDEAFHFLEDVMSLHNIPLFKPKKIPRAKP